MMKKLRNNLRGFTMIEVTLVIMFLALITVIGLRTYRSAQLRVDLNSQVEKFVGEVRLARTNAIAGVNGSEHGVHLETDSYTIFAGGSYSPSDPSNYQIALPGTFEIQNITLNGGGSDVVFDAIDGETVNDGTLDFASTQINKTVTVTISRLGVINY